MGFRLFLVFVALTAVINLSGRCRGQSICIFTPCDKPGRKEVRTENLYRNILFQKLTLLDTMSNLTIQCNIYNHTTSIILAL